MSDLFEILKTVNDERIIDPSIDLKLHRIEDLKELPLQITEGGREAPVVFERLDKRLSRVYSSEYTGKRLSVTTVKNLYLTAHLTRADISIMNDFSDFKELLSIVGKEFVTLGKGFEYDGCNVFLRDTMLLAPGNQKSLKAIGKLYGSVFNKKELTTHEISNMDELLSKNKTKFLEYSKMDAVIPLIHSLSMEQYNWKVKALGVPLTLSSLATRYVRTYWDQEEYPGYQISPQYLLGDASRTQTPLGLYATEGVGLKLPLFISSYKGGRNESFMYGVNTDKIWYDYDLVSAYTTVLAGAGHPKYKRAHPVDRSDFEK